MSLLNDTKQELLENKISGPCCKRAFLAGVIRGAGSLSLEPEGFGLLLQHPVPELIEKCATVDAHNVPVITDGAAELFN